MAWQSSRIIWDKNKTDSSEPQPVTIYDPTGTIYVAGNYALHSDHSGSVAEDYQLYLCKVEETGSDFVSSDWELQKGVKNWYLIARRQFKKGARVIKSDTNGDTASLRLYKCISSMKQPNVWNPDEWEVVYQDVGVAYEVRDHKDVYYDSGSNRNKWHKMMYYLLPENPDKSDEEIEIFSEDRVYHKDDYVIKVKNNNEVALFKYISNTPRAGWDPTRWSEDVSVAEYEANIPYNKGDWIIRKYIEIYEFVIMEFQAGLRYYNGKYCLHIINPDDINPDIPVFNENVTYSRGDKVSYNRGLWEYNLNIPLSGPWIPAYWDNIGKTFPDWYRERILGGESLYGLYRANTTVCGSWNDIEWDLIIDGVIQIRGRDYNTRGLCIMQFQIGQDYLAGDVVIWTATNDTSEFGLSVAKVDIYNCSPAQAPPNETNWNNITETLENPDQYHVYKAKDNMTAGYNSHFRRDDWLIVTQKILPDDGLYGVIWEKYGKPGGGGGIPFGFPLVISCATHNNVNRWDSAFCNFYPFMGNSCLEIENVFTGAYYTPYLSGGIGFNTSIVFGIYTYHMGETYAESYSYLTGLYILNVGKFKKADFYDQEEKKWFLRYYENTLLYMIKADTNLNTHAGIIYKSYFFDGNIFGKTEVFRIRDEIDRESGHNLYWFDNNWNDQYENRDPLYLASDNPGTQIFIKHEKMYEVFGKPEMIVAEWYINRPNDDQMDYGDMHIYKQVMCVMNWDGDIIEIPYFTRYFSTGVKWHHHHSGYREEYYDDRYFRGYLGYYTTNQPSINRLECGEAFHSLNPNSPLSDPDILALAPLVSQLEERKLLLIFYSDYYNQHENSELDAPKNAWTIYAGAYGGRTGEESPTETSLGGHYYYYYCYSPSSQEQSSGYGSVNSYSRIRGTLYNDRNGNMFIVATKHVQVTHVAYEESQTVAAQYWTLIKITRQGQYSEIPIMTISVEDMASDSVLKFIARDGYNLYFRWFTSGQISTAGILSLQTGTISETTFPRYFDLPYVGNQKFRVDNVEYSKVRVLLIGHTASDRDDVPSDTYLMSRFSTGFLDTYWTPYMTTTGGVAHTGDFCKAIGSDYDSDSYGWVVYIPQLCHNPLGIGGFAWMYGYKSGNGPYYGGPSNNGFIHM